MTESPTNLQAERAKHILDDPFFKGVWNELRHQLVSELENVTLDGSAESENHVMECARKLKSLQELKAEFIAAVGQGRLTEASTNHLEEVKSTTQRRRRIR